MNCRVYRRMRNHSCRGEGARIHANNVVRNRISPAKDAGRHRCCCKRAISIVDLFDLASAEDIGDVGYIANICDIDNAQILNVIVIPGKEGLVWPQRKPRHHIKSAK
jgi:hypothetical protein